MSFVTKTEGVIYAHRLIIPRSDVDVGPEVLRFPNAGVLPTNTNQKADERTRTADLLITSGKKGVAGVCTGLRNRHF